MNKNILQNLKIVVLGLILSAGLAFAWTGPTAPPPGNNAPAPINVSANKQAKEGVLSLLNGLIVGSSASQNLDPFVNLGVYQPGSTTGGLIVAGAEILTGGEQVGDLAQTNPTNATATYPAHVCAEANGHLILCGAPVTYQCSDGIDNDSDTFIDMNDSGCTSPTDNDESNIAASGGVAYERVSGTQMKIYDVNCTACTSAAFVPPVTGTYHVYVWGGGGGGGKPSAGPSSSRHGGGGGGAGEYREGTFSFAAGNAVTINVGNGGTAGTSGFVSGPGGQTIVGSYITSNGGTGGGAATGNANGTGGSGGSGGSGGYVISSGGSGGDGLSTGIGGTSGLQNYTSGSSKGDGGTGGTQLTQTTITSAGAGDTGRVYITW